MIRLQIIFVFIIFSLFFITNIVLADSFGTLSWQLKAPVIDVTGFGSVGVEGAAAGLINGKIYVSHGYSFGDNAALRIYDITTNTWSLGPSANIARSELGGASVEGKLYVIGGRPVVSGIGDALEIFNPATNQWVNGPAMLTPRAGFGISVLNGKIHVIGGRNGDVPHSGNPLAVHEVFDPATNNWIIKAPLLIPMMDNYATVAFNNKIYVFGGFDGANVSNIVQIYDSFSNSWSFGSSMPTARSNAIAGILKDHPIVIGGLSNTFTNTNIVEIFHPESNNWTAGPSKSIAASEMASAAPFNDTAIFTIGRVLLVYRQQSTKRLL